MMTPSRRSWLAALLCTGALSILLAGCGDRNATSPPSSSSSSSSESDQSSQSQLDEGDPMDGEGAQKVVRTFMDALKNGDEATIDQLTSSEPGTYSGWTNTKFDRITAKILSESGDLSSYELTFQVEESGDPFFPVGTCQRIVTVGYSNFGAFGIIGICTPDEPDYYEKPPIDESRPGYQAYLRLSSYLNLMDTILFENTSEIPLNEVVDYALIQCAQEYPEKYYFSQADVQSMVNRCFGLPYFDGTSSKYYDPEHDRYEIWGRGGFQRNMRTRSVSYDASKKTYEIPVDFYSDILCTHKNQRVLYTLGENPDGSIHLISAVAQS